MKLNFEKKIRILDDLLYYCHSIGATDYGVNIRIEPGAVTFEVHCPIESISEEELLMVTETLNRPRQREVEQLCWGMAGEGEQEGNLDMVGIMIDEAEVSYEDGILNIIARRFV